MDACQTTPRLPWNKGKLIGQKPPLKLRKIWGIRIRLQLAGNPGDLALFNLAIDSKLRGCGLALFPVGIAKLTACDRSTPVGSRSNRRRAVPGREGSPAQRPVMIRRHQLAAEVEEVRDGCVHANESLRLPHGFESPHRPLPYSGRLVGEFDPIVRVPRGLVDRIGDEFPPGDGVTAQPVRHDLAWLTLSQQSLDEALCSIRVSSLLEQHVDDFAVLVDGPPQVPPLTSDPDEDLVQVESVAVAAVPAPQPMRIPGPELVAPEANRLVGDQDASPGQDVLDVPMT